MKLLLTVSLVAGAVGTANAQPGPKDRYPLLREEPITHASITIAPFLMAIPVIEFTGELRLARRLGAALILGVGQATARNSVGEQQRINLFEVGGQLNFYLFHELRGVHLGIEPTYVYANNARPDSSIYAAGLVVGPLIGWKYVHAIGFTFVAQAGAQFLVHAGGVAENPQTDDRKVFPLLNLNVGWSF